MFFLENFEGQIFYNSYSYRESNHLYVFSQTNQHKIKIHNYEIKGKSSSFFKMTYIDLSQIEKSNKFNEDRYLPILITSTNSKDLISIYQKEDKIIDSESEYLNVNVKSLSLRTCKANNKLRSFGA